MIVHIFYDIQIFITRTYTKELEELDSFYITSFAILKNKELETSISNFLFINPEYIFDIYVKIKFIKNNYCQFLKFLEYFYKTYLVGHDMKIWNYYNNMEHITSNASESLNNYLNNLFPTKPSFYELIDKLNEVEHLSYYDYQRKIRGI
ncbi:hypothetical protein LY90DRAFT_510825 [Neocallimastix californiae]|uniref:Uncharacterized protein n=1 Tax=Neocallimastix californiae TaxID=1754190 RepID=A0A1Y2BX89_9FUNG|nr:hypothetical protein LY90DRAFT_510825 [Neocallimastix californiae]|eukprot:ORY38715.1 hypothetical protein LY90DRAFT_510825 [Neocallimastix californiae]